MSYNLRENKTMAHDNDFGLDGTVVTKVAFSKHVLRVVTSFQKHMEPKARKRPPSIQNKYKIPFRSRLSLIKNLYKDILIFMGPIILVMEYIYI